MSNRAAAKFRRRFLVRQTLVRRASLLIALLFLQMLLVPLRSSAADADRTRFTRECGFKKGDRVEAVKSYYGIAENPMKLEKEWAGGTAYQYHFTEWGVWVFFDRNQQVTSIRFDPPFTGTIGGIKLGDSMEQVRQKKGEPQRQFDGLFDEETRQEYDRARRRILEALPDPAPKKDVLKAFEEMQRIPVDLMKMSPAWSYGSGDASLRLDFGAISKTVKVIIAPRCNAE